MSSDYFGMWPKGMEHSRKVSLVSESAQGPITNKMMERDFPRGLGNFHVRRDHPLLALVHFETKCGLVISGYGLSVFLFSTISHVFFTGSASPFYFSH